MIVSNELENWAKLAGFSLARNTDGTADVFWNSSGETRYFVAKRQDNWTEVTCSDRLGPEFFIFAGASARVVERFLFGWFGNTYRNNNKMPSLVRVAAKVMAQDYEIRPQEFDGVDRYALVDPTKGVIAISSGGRLMAPDRLSLLSVLLHANIGDIGDSFRRTDGSPLLTVRN